jgi:phage shock protein PspC (stress-responsive transcriptional regulator)
LQSLELRLQPDDRRRVCALARRFGMKPWQVRLLVVLSCRLPGPQVLLYVALWIILPVE